METSFLPSVANGDADAVKACLARYGGLVWSLARRFSRNTSEAEDAVQEVFVDLWKSAARFDPKMGSEATFVTMIARRRLIDRRRRSVRRLDTEPMPEFPLPAQEGTPDAEMTSEARLASRAIAELRPEQQQVLILATVHGLTHDEIATQTGMPLGTVKAHVRRGLLRVRELLGQPAVAPAMETSS